MSKKYKNPNRQGFYNHINTIKSAERDKDAFLRAAKLERHERQSRFASEDIISILVILCIFGSFALLVLGS